MDTDFSNIENNHWMSPNGQVLEVIDLPDMDPTELPEYLGRMILKMLLVIPERAMFTFSYGDVVVEVSRSEIGAPLLIRQVK